MANGKVIMAHGNCIMAQLIAPNTTVDFIDTQQACLMHLEFEKELMEMFIKG
jgi:hypothetical protein